MPQDCEAIWERIVTIVATVVIIPYSCEIFFNFKCIGGRNRGENGSEILIVQNFQHMLVGRKH